MRGCRGAEAVDDAFAGEGVGVDDVCPGDDGVDPGRVLVLHGVSDVCELAVFEDEEVVDGGEAGERGGEGGDCVGARGGESEDVDVGFDEADFGGEFCVGKQGLVGGFD